MTKKPFVLSNNPLFGGPALVEREAQKPAPVQSSTPYREIPLADIERDVNQPRINFDEEALEELTTSIKTYGVLSPIMVKPGNSVGKFQVISGERRFRAAQRAGLSTIPCIVDQNDDASGTRTLAIQLVENLQRSDLTSLERAHAINALKEAHGLSVRDVSERLGISKSSVQRSLDILNLPDDLLNALRQGASESKILILAKVEDPRLRAQLLKEIDNLSRTELENSILRLSRERNDKKMATARVIKISAEDSRITDELQRALGLKVTMSRTNPQSEKGRLIIEFYSDEDLQEIFRKLHADA